MLTMEPGVMGAFAAKLAALTTELIEGNPCPRTASSTVLLVLPPMVSDNERFPDDNVAGAVKNTRYFPMDDGSSSARWTRAPWPSTATPGVVTASAGGAEGAATPVGIAGCVAPSPTASKERASAGFAGLLRV